MPDLPMLRLLRRIPVFLRLPVIKALHRRHGSQLSLSPEEFQAKRVLILGPARTLAEDLQAIDVSDYDLLVKMNNGLDTPVPLPQGDGMRCDVLFHSATRDARPITEAKLQRAGVQLLVHRTPTKSGFLQTLMLNARFKALLRVRHIDWQVHCDLAGRLGGASPTTGLLAACFFLNAPVAQLGIVGFTFFSTAYQAGYDDCVGSDAQSVCRIVEKGHHAPSAEAALLSREIAAARDRGMVVTLGPHVAKAMQCCAARDDG
ncbi:hypothetical protein [Paracoccus sp. R86501]|uniref:hypothetical protein n=1 Tax=Paracoccus sp. R86501 TaxID=3101711 RepID=UPI00366F3AA5